MKGDNCAGNGYVLKFYGDEECKTEVKLSGSPAALADKYQITWDECMAKKDMGMQAVWLKHTKGTGTSLAKVITGTILAASLAVDSVSS